MKKGFAYLQTLFRFIGGTSGGRTHDKRIKSAQLCTTIRYIFNVKKRDKKVVCELLHCSNRVKTWDFA